MKMRAWCLGASLAAVRTSRSRDSYTIPTAVPFRERTKSYDSRRRKEEKAIQDRGLRPPPCTPVGANEILTSVRAVEFAFGIGWGGFWVYWLVAAFSMKRGHVPWARELRIRAVVVVLVIVLVRFGAFRGHALNTDPSRAVLGLVIFALGLGFAIWARLHIGRNWGTPMTQKDDPELVTSGPYHLVRHPIYSGILVAGVGTAVALSWWWLIAAGLAGVYFVYSAAVEERNIASQFPQMYPEYRRSTKMFLPYIF